MVSHFQNIQNETYLTSLILIYRSDSGSYEGVDESNVKLEVTCDKFPPLRKTSKMLNGLGDDM